MNYKSLIQYTYVPVKLKIYNKLMSTDICINLDNCIYLFQLYEHLRELKLSKHLL